MDRRADSAATAAGVDGEEAADWIGLVAQTRDDAAFDRLYCHFAPRIRAYGRRMGFSDEMADDLIQETLVSVWRHAERFDPDRGEPWPWIFTIARNLLVDMNRREAIRREVLQTAEHLPRSAPEPPLDLRQAGMDLARALGRLPAAQATVLKLALVEDCSHGEIADRLGLPLGTVKSRLRLATSRLQSGLDADGAAPQG